jgi:hypothetical protein
MRDIGAGLQRFAASDEPWLPIVLGESRTPLWADDAVGERDYQLGKVQNLRRAIRHLDRVVVPADGVFSFWKQVGRASRRRGFVTGRMLQGGCLVPARGGGLCQLSNALYDVALQAGCEIVERHAHSRIVPGSVSARDATVAWNYVDFRFRPGQRIQIEARVERQDLVIRFRGDTDVAHPAPQRPPLPLDAFVAARSCASCGETSCFRHEHHAVGITGRTVFLVDENWPELQEYVHRTHGETDVLGLPLDGARWRLPRYRWDTAGFAHVETASLQAVHRAVAMRRLPMQGAARRARELAAAERIAHRLSRLLTADVTTVYVTQSLLPFLWREGHLGGRDVRVLMTRLPMSALQSRLDHTAALHPERETLRDFRAPPGLAEAEMAALDYATAIITPHARIAELFATKATHLPWRMPAATARGATQPGRIAFPGPTVARKGAFELREAARALDLEIVCLGSELEGPDFWEGVRTGNPDPDWLQGVAAVVQPAIIEDNPRRLLAALAARIPVVATAACGIAEHELLTLVPENDPAALTGALRQYSRSFAQHL